MILVSTFLSTARTLVAWDNDCIEDFVLYSNCCIAILSYPACNFTMIPPRLPQKQVREYTPANVAAFGSSWLLLCLISYSPISISPFLGDFWVPSTRNRTNDSCLCPGHLYFACLISPIDCPWVGTCFLDELTTV